MLNPVLFSLFRLWSDSKVSLLGRDFVNTDSLWEEVIKLVFLNLKERKILRILISERI